MPGFIVSGTGEGIASTFEPFYNYTWKVKKLFGSFIEEILLQDCGTPSVTVKTEESQGTALIYSYASEVKWDPVNLVFYDTYDLYGYLKQWRESVWNPDDGLAMASQYKDESTLDTFLADGTKTVTWTLYGSWPSTIKNGDLTYTSSNAKFVTVTMTYDWAVESGGPKGKPKAGQTAQNGSDPPLSNSFAGQFTETPSDDGRALVNR